MFFESFYMVLYFIYYITPYLYYISYIVLIILLTYLYNDDNTILQIEKDAQAVFPNTLAAREGLEIILPA